MACYDQESNIFLQFQKHSRMMEICSSDVCLSLPHNLMELPLTSSFHCSLLWKKASVQSGTLVCKSVCTLLAAYVASRQLFTCTVSLVCICSHHHHVWITYQYCVNIVHFLLVTENIRFNKKSIKIVVYVTEVFGNTRLLY